MNELEELLGTDILYVIRGTGSERDNYATIATLLEFIASGLNGITFNGPEGANTMSNTSVSIEGSSGEMQLTQQELTFTKDGTTYSATINRNGITITSSGGSVVISSNELTVSKTSGGVTKTITLEPDLSRFKSIKGTTLAPGGSAFVLTIEDILEVLGNLVARGNVTVGASDAKRSLTVHGSVIADKISNAAFNVTANVISDSSDVDFTTIEEGSYIVGDILHVYNTGSSTNKVYIGTDVSDMLRQYILINPGCMISFRCVATKSEQYETHWRWVPFGNHQYFKDNG